MPCGCVDNKNLNKDKLSLENDKKLSLENDKRLSLESIQNLSIDEIINLYRQGYTLSDVDTLSEVPNINALTYNTQCSGSPEITSNHTSPLLGTYGVTQKGMVWAQRFYGNFRCLDFVQFNMQRYANVDFYIEIRKDDGIGEGKPIGVPLIDDAGLITRTPPISYLDVPMSWGWVSPTVAAILPTDAYYWICFVPIDFYDSPIYRDDPTDDRIGLQDITNDITLRSANFKNGTWTNSSTFGFALFKLPTFVSQCISMSNVSASPTTALVGESVVLGAQASPAGIYTVEFYDTITNTVLCSDSPGTSETMYSCLWVPSAAGVFQVKARVAGQCTSPSTTQVTINCSPSVSGVTANPTTVQLGQAVTLTSMVTPAGAYTVQFIKPDGTVLASDTSSTSKMTYSATWTPSVTGVYSIVAKTSTQPLSCANQPVETVTVSAPITCTTITLSANPTSGNIGTIINLTATVTDPPNTAGFNVTFKDGATTLTTVATNSSGVATYAWNTTGQTAGSHSLTANVSTQCTSTAVPVNLTSPTPVLSSITISPASQSINIGGVVQLTAVCKDQNNVTMTCPALAWSSSNSAIASVNPSTGLVTGVAAGGPVNITAAVGTVTSNASAITVTGITSVLTYIVISPTSASIGIGGTKQLTAVCKNQNNATMTCPTLTWASNNLAKATVNSSGLVTGVAEGTANVTAAAGTVTSNASVITVTIVPPQEAGGGAIVIAAAALIAAAMFMARKPPTQSA